MELIVFEIFLSRPFFGVYFETESMVSCGGKGAKIEFYGVDYGG